MFTIDAHLDLSMNALEWNRDLTKPVAEINEREKGLTDKPDRGKATVSLPELRKGNMGLVMATQIARYVAPGNPLPGWHSPEQAWAQTQGHLAWYRAMEERGEMVQIKTRGELQQHLKLWEPFTENSTTSATKEKLPIGYILSLEGADSILSFKHLERSYEQGLRALGPAHYGPGLYAQGTGEMGKFPARGKELLREMDRLGIILDVTHLTDEEFLEALDLFRGPMWASHHDCRVLAPNQRQLSDEQIKALA